MVLNYYSNKYLMIFIGINGLRLASEWTEGEIPKWLKMADEIATAAILTLKNAIS